MKPTQLIFNITSEQPEVLLRERMEARGVRFVRRDGRESRVGVYSTPVDRDGNYGQLMAFDPMNVPAVATEAHS